MNPQGNSNSLQQASSSGTGGLYNNTLSNYQTTYTTTTTGGTYIGNGYITYQYPQWTSGWPQTQAEPPTKAEQWVFQRAILHAELKNFCGDIVKRSLLLAMWAFNAYSFSMALVWRHPVNLGVVWMIGLIPLMALAAKQRILQWGDRFLG